MARVRKPKTAYELCEMVCEAIKAHPLSYYQGVWKASRRAARWDTRAQDLVRNPGNTCGTAFCRAGWMVQLVDGRVTNGIRRCERRARTLLGMPVVIDEFGCEVEDDVSALFDSEALHMESGNWSEPGTKSYVRDGIAGLRRFMKKHEAHLKARSLRGV